jgi:hypothetical protein
MRRDRLEELQEMAASLLATTHDLPPGQDRHNALREVGTFRNRIVDLQRQEMQSAVRGPKAKQ